MMGKNIKIINIGGRIVGEGCPPLVIVEIGINHGGSLEEAFKLVDAAYLAGAEVIKHQTHVVEDEMSMEARKVIPGNSNKSIYEIMEECSLDETEEISLKNYIESKGMIFISTPFSRAAADRLERMKVSAFKIGSGECNNFPLIEHIASFGKPMIVSTGMNNIKSISGTVEILEHFGIDYALLHTTNLYPTPSHLVRLGAMQTLQTEFPNAIVGLSDHTTSNLACYGAIALGAHILERHFTDSMDREGPDIINSMDTLALKELISGSIELSKMTGGKKEAALEEQVTIDFAFATVVATKDITKGEVFSESNIWVKRPGTGEIKASDYKSLISRKSSIDIKKDTHIKWSYVN